MKTPSIIKGLIVALIVGLLTHVVRTASAEVTNTLIACAGLFLVILFTRKYRIDTERDARLIQNGLNHYREHIHHKRVIKKTS